LLVSETLGAGRFKRGRYLVHFLLAIYAVILVYIVLSLALRYNVSADVFFGLSFALLFFSLGQSLYELGLRKTIIFFLVSSLIGYFAEVLGTSSGFPFGKYYYTDFLGEKILGVPIVVPLVWFVISYLAFSVAASASSTSKRVDLSTFIKVALLSAFGAVAWDFLVDPMFSSYGYWVWTGQFVSLPELDGIPLTNFVGWFTLVTLMIFGYLIAAKRLIRHDEGNPLMGRRNTIDSVVAYLLLLVDGVMANYALGNIAVIVVGAISMFAFSAICLLRSRPKVTTGNNIKHSITQS